MKRIKFLSLFFAGILSFSMLSTMVSASNAETIVTVKALSPLQRPKNS